MAGSGATTSSKYNGVTNGFWRELENWPPASQMMDSGFAGCFQLSSGSLLWNLPDLRPSGFPSVHRWQETRTRHKRKCHDNGRTRKRPFSRRLVWLPWLEYFPTERMEERTSLEAERSLPLSQTVPLSSPSDVPWTFQSRVVGFGLSLHFTKIYSLVKVSQMSHQAPSQHQQIFITRCILFLNIINAVFINEP